MYLRQNRNKKTGRIYLSIVHGYRDNQGKSKQKTIQKIGYVDELLKDYADPIAHFEAVAAQMDKERLENKMITLTLDTSEQLECGIAHKKNYGHVVFSKIYHELEIDRFLKNARRHKKFKFNTDAIMRLLTFSRLLYPNSKRATVLKKDAFFDNFNFSLDDVYDSLTHFDTISPALQQHLHERVTEISGRQTDLVYYDVTNYYFEIDKEDELRKKGPSKEHRKDPIVQMGLLLDRAGLPISYKLFPGNTHDSQTLMPVLTAVKKKFGVKRIIAVADKGLNSGDNIAYNSALGDGYIYSKSIRGASDEFKTWVLDQADYRIYSNEHKLKSKKVPDAAIQITVEQQAGKRKKKKSVKVEQKWISFYSEKYAKRAKFKREEAISKALKLIENPSKYKRNFDYGAVGYIENVKIDKETGEISNVEEKLILDFNKIAEEEKYDGYYAIITSEMDTPDTEIIDIYRGLWRIEESFKVTKSVLDARPVFLHTSEHINAHFLICFIALLIARIVEVRLGGKYNIEKITDILRSIECGYIQQNLWMFTAAEVSFEDFNKVFGTNFGLKYMTLAEIKKSLGNAKKS